MTILLELDPDTEARLKAQAERRGIAPEQYAGQLLDKAIASESAGPGILTPEEFHTMLCELAEDSERLPSLPTSAFSRESIYEDRL
jgi:hypothetical protein